MCHYPFKLLSNFNAQTPFQSGSPCPTLLSIHPASSLSSPGPIIMGIPRMLALSLLSSYSFPRRVYGMMENLAFPIPRLQLTLSVDSGMYLWLCPDMTLGCHPTNPVSEGSGFLPQPPCWSPWALPHCPGFLTSQSSRDAVTKCHR